MVFVLQFLFLFILKDVLNWPGFRQQVSSEQSGIKGEILFFDGRDLIFFISAWCANIYNVFSMFYIHTIMPYLCPVVRHFPAIRFISTDGFR